MHGRQRRLDESQRFAALTGLTDQDAFSYTNERQKLFLYVKFSSPYPLLSALLNTFFLLSLEKRGKMGRSAVLTIIHTITIGTMPNVNGGNYGHGQKNVTSKHT